MLSRCFKSDGFIKPHIIAAMKEAGYDPTPHHSKSIQKIPNIKREKNEEDFKKVRDLIKEKFYPEIQEWNCMLKLFFS